MMHLRYLRAVTSTTVTYFHVLLFRCRSGRRLLARRRQVVSVGVNHHGHTVGVYISVCRLLIDSSEEFQNISFLVNVLD